MASIEGPKAATDITKQIITLSTGAVAFTITFLDKFRTTPEGTPLAVPWALYVSWVLFGLTILFALLNLMGITGTLEAIDRKANNWTMTPAQTGAADGSKSHERWPAICMLLFFLLAVISMIAAGFSVANDSAAPDNASSAAPANPIQTRYDETMSGQPLTRPPKPFQLLVTQATFQPGHVITCHKHTWPRYVYLQQGNLRVTNYDAHRVDEFHAGQILVEAIGQWHQGQVMGPGPVTLVAFEQVPPGQNNSTPWPPPPPPETPCRPWAR